MSLAIRSLEAWRGENLVFSDISIDLSNGEAVLVTGENGSGKSTFLRVLAGLLPKRGGEISLSPESDIPLHEMCHYLGHQNALKPSLSVEENLVFWQKFSGEPLLSPDIALEAVGLPDVGHLPAGYLSAGQKRRVAIARLLVSRKPFWLVDEPTAALDRRSEMMFEDLCHEHMDMGGMIIAATHQPLDLGDAKSLVFGEAVAGDHGDDS